MFFLDVRDAEKASYTEGSFNFIWLEKVEKNIVKC
jgi:hypothetical protein